MVKKTKLKPTIEASAFAPRDITLAGKVFSVPMLRISINREAYPLCARLTSSGVLDRIGSDGTINLSGEDIDALADLAFWGTLAADGNLTREEFDEMPISPVELIDAFIVMRWQTGGWLPASLPTA